MIVLLDTSTSECRLTLVTGESRSEYTWQADRELAKGLLAFLRDSLKAQEKTFSDIAGLGIFRGPGSFTGLRIGMTVMNTLADSLEVSIVGVTGDDWQDRALERLSHGETDALVLPEYGGEANITKPRK